MGVRRSINGAGWKEKYVGGGGLYVFLKVERKNVDCVACLPGKEWEAEHKWH